jgi:hypothetical protein
MTKNVFIPKSLDVNLLIATDPPTIKDFTKERLLIVLNFISEVSSYNDESESSDGFVSLYSKKLQSGVHDYKQYLNYLISNKIIETDNRYVVGKKCRGYKYSDRYNTEVVEVEVEIKTYRKRQRFKKLTISERISLHQHEYVTKWINDISIDYSGANMYLKSLKESNVSGDLHIIKSYNSGKMSLSKIDNKEFYCHIDQTSNRLHTNLTNLGSNLRKYLRYKDKPLVSFDIKNSQLYFVTALLSTSFYRPGNKLNINRLKLISIEHAEIASIAGDAIIMLEKLDNIPNSIDIKLFIELVSSGEFYDYLLLRANEMSIRRLTDRNKIKQDVFLLIFSKDYIWRSRPDSFRRLFTESFPTVYKLFSIIKKKNHNSLAILLQRIESYLVIDIICKEISRFNPDIPLFTIHDSIATTDEFSELVYKIMNEILTSLVGVSPSLKKEVWK